MTICEGVMETRVAGRGRRQPNRKNENRKYPDQAGRRAEPIELIAKRNL
jgi:hypothetical protein